MEGSVGMHAGAQMSGGSLVLDAGAAEWLGAEMKGGSIEGRGRAGDQVGAAYRGSRRGMTGGTIVMRGSAGDELGLLLRRGLIVVEGACGEFAGASMIAGTLVLLGEVGERCGAVKPFRHGSGSLMLTWKVMFARPGSETKIAVCSQAAKWVPLGNLLYWMSFTYAFSDQLLGA